MKTRITKINYSFISAFCKHDGRKNASLYDYPIPATKFVKIYLATVGIIDLLLAIGKVATNLLVQYVFIVKLKRYKRSSDVLLILLGASDFLAALVVDPVLSFCMIMWSANKPVCDVIRFSISIGVMTTFVSISTIACITYDKSQNHTHKVSELKHFANLIPAVVPCVCLNEGICSCTPKLPEPNFGLIE